MLQCDKCHKWDTNKRKLHGCLGPTPQHIPIYSVPEFEIELYECPGKLITPKTRNLLDLYGMCEALHCLPEEGGYLDQPSDLMHAFKVIKTVESLSIKSE